MSKLESALRSAHDIGNLVQAFAEQNPWVVGLQVVGAFMACWALRRTVQRGSILLEALTAKISEARARQKSRKTNKQIDQWERSHYIPHSGDTVRVLATGQVYLVKQVKSQGLVLSKDKDARVSYLVAARDVAPIEITVEENPDYLDLDFEDPDFLDHGI